MRNRPRFIFPCSLVDSLDSTSIFWLTLAKLKFFQEIRLLFFQYLRQRFTHQNNFPVVITTALKKKTARSENNSCRCVQINPHRNCFHLCPKKKRKKKWFIGCFLQPPTAGAMNQCAAPYRLAHTKFECAFTPHRKSSFGAAASSRPATANRRESA